MTDADKIDEAYFRYLDNVPNASFPTDTLIAQLEGMLKQFWTAACAWQSSQDAAEIERLQKTISELAKCVVCRAVMPDQSAVVCAPCYGKAVAEIARLRKIIEETWAGLRADPETCPNALGALKAEAEREEK